MLIGVDEVGLGCWAGPLVVCAFAAPDESWTLEGLGDSKEYKSKEQKKLRTQLAHALMRNFKFSLVVAPVEDIDTYGIDRTHRKAMELAIYELIYHVGVPDRVVVDGKVKPVDGAECYPKADSKFPCVSAASVIAKVHRDGLMAEYAVTYPQYGFDRHVGYGTKVHHTAMLAHGLCPLHRRSYDPMKTILGG